MEDRLEFESFDQFLQQAERVKVMYSMDGYLFFDSYTEIEKHYERDILLPRSELIKSRKYYVIKANN